MRFGGQSSRGGYASHCPRNVLRLQCGQPRRRYATRLAGANRGVARSTSVSPQPCCSIQCKSPLCPRWVAPVLPTLTRHRTPYRQQSQPVAKYLNGADDGDAARRRAEPARYHRSLPAVARWRRGPWVIDALYLKRPYDATERSTP